MLSVTAIYAGILAILYVLLSNHVAGTRRAEQISLGDGDSKRLQRRSRAHGNFAEYAPFGLLLLALLEAQGAPGWAIHALGLLLLFGRLLHGAAFLRRRMSLPLRVAGMGLTFAAIGLSGAGLLAQALL